MIDAAWTPGLATSGIWKNDEFIRSKSRRLITEEETYVLRTSTDIVIAFSIAGDTVTILSIFRDEAVNKFVAMTAQSAT